MLTVVSWNLNSWQRPDAAQRRATWEYLRDDLGADVALVQEATPPPFEHHAVGTFDTGHGRPWGTAVVDLTGVGIHPVTELRTPDGKGTQPLAWHTPGTAAAVTVGEGTERTTLVSLYGLFVGGSSYATMLRHAADLSPLLADPAHRRLLIAGDLNTTTQWVGADAGYNPIEQAILDNFTAWGLRDLIASSDIPADPGCDCEAERCRHARTHRHRSSERPWQVDHAFATPQLEVPGVAVDHEALNAGLSDHAPLVLQVSSGPDERPTLARAALGSTEA